ncbi:MAG: LysR family transcriptional regulator [Nitratireductor sp.]|nr:LysR family transcriptional regulator [Nitratireductor sp.]
MAYVRNLKTFVRVYDLGSMSAAGRDLRVSAAVASSRIAELEKHLGIRLFNRTTRTVTPTEQGRLFYKGAIKILDTIDEVESGIAEITANPKGTIFVSAPLGMGKRLIAPLVPAFKEEYPDLNVRLRLSDRRVDVAAEGLDAAFVLGPLGDSEMRIKKVYDFERVLCASPAYLEAHGVPESGEDLVEQRHKCLMLRFPGTSEYAWNLRTGEGVRKFSFDAPLESDDGDVLTAWALAGCGIINKPRFEVAPYLVSGELVSVAEATPPTDLPFSCIYPHKRLQDMKVRLFIDYMVAGCKQALGQ